MSASQTPLYLAQPQGFRIRDGRLQHASTGIHTSLLRLEVVADNLRSIQQVANGKIDSAVVNDMNSFKVATVMITNVDNLAAQFAIQV